VVLPTQNSEKAAIFYLHYSTRIYPYTIYIFFINTCKMLPVYCMSFMYGPCRGVWSTDYF